MQKCKYSHQSKCDVCEVVFHTQCKKFMLYHAAFLTSEIQPVKFKKIKDLRQNVVWSRIMDVAKSAALQYSLHLNKKIKKLSLNQVITCTINDEIPESGVFYIECNTKPQGDVEKVSSVIKSFVDKVQLDGCYVAIYVAPNTTINLEDYRRLC